ncbi:hypothetical protein ANN_07286 [Periplaneta americana]|uniref:FLYWCH-type domain-containing protein n=1 Tax=Periplaneta americana TaxID=6978 RepID=A0ABQ8TGS4_PERAM|nr:hypothetical protein ANN_07286 [Periplaneta americana]
MERNPQLVPSQKGKPLLSFRGYLYQRHDFNRDRTEIYWRCRERKICNAAMITNSNLDNIRDGTDKHLHSADEAAYVRPNASKVVYTYHCSSIDFRYMNGLGRSQNGTHCRYCRSEKETLAHILGACLHGELLRNSRHHKIRSLLASALRRKNYQVEEEVHGLSTNGSTRRNDIIAIPTRSTSGFIIDPTVRMEMYENQPAEVHQEKCDIYDPAIPYYKEKYHLTSIEVIGLLMGLEGPSQKDSRIFVRSLV